MQHHKGSGKRNMVSTIVNQSRRMQNVHMGRNRSDPSLTAPRWPKRTLSRLIKQERTKIRGATNDKQVQRRMIKKWAKLRGGRRNNLMGKQTALKLYLEVNQRTKDHVRLIKIVKHQVKGQKEA